MNSADWDYAHADYGPGQPISRPSPTGLIGSEPEWRTRLEQAPNGHLLRDNAMLHALTSGRTIHLMHTTASLPAIRATGQLYGAAGCLVGTLYCAPLTEQRGRLRPHNLGAHLLATKQNRDVLVFEITPGVPAPALGLDYLRLGAVHLRVYERFRAFLSDEEDHRLREAATARIRAGADNLNALIRAATRHDTRPSDFVDLVAATIVHVPFLGYVYFEALSEYLMLNSTAARTRELAALGEMNNELYKQLAFGAVTTMGQLFDLALFKPDHLRLNELIGAIEPNLADGAADYVRARLPYMIACSALDPSQDATEVSFHVPDFDTLAACAPLLAGQMIFRELRRHPRYPSLFPVFEQAKAFEADAYWNSHRIAAPFNGVTGPKGEIGINLAYPYGTHRTYTARISADGLLEPDEELDLAFVPRLTDLYGTALGHRAFPAHQAHPVH